MINYCPECGIKLEKEFKFCPNCGTEIVIHHSESDDSSSSKETVEEFIICDNCGEENNPDNKTCAVCGVILKGERVKKDLAKPVESHSTERAQTYYGTGKQEKKAKVSAAGTGKRKTKKQKVKQQYPPEDKKTLETKTLLVIFGVVTAVIILILFASGVFDTNQVNQTVTQNTQQQIQSVDMSMIERINELERIIKSNPADYESLLELAHARNDAGFYEAAIQDYKKYLEHHPDDADARIDMGVCYFNLGNYTSAISEMKKALDYEPNHQIGHLNLGVVNLTAGNLDEARQWLQKAVNINSTTEAGKRAQELLTAHL